MIDLKDRPTSISLLPIALALVLSISLLLLGRFLPPRLPLFYSLAWGENQLVTLEQFLIIPVTMVCITLINLMVGWQLHEAQELFKYILILTSLTTTLILTISFIKVILIFF